MSQLEDLFKGLGGGGQGGLGARAGEQGGGMAALLPVLAPLIAQLLAGGGLQKLLAGFQQQGMGDKADSWVGKGENQQVSAAELRRAVGDDTIRDAATRAGVSEEEAASGLARLLPQVVDRITPEGRVPEQTEVDQAAKQLEALARGPG
jgi:uncharacterized protein YidB (DUF937 family)